MPAQTFTLDARQDRQYATDPYATAAFAAANPGRLYIHTDEPDQGCVAPADYAVQFHDFVEIVRSSDPTARFSPAGFAEPNAYCCAGGDYACYNSRHYTGYAQQFYDAYVSIYGVAPPVAEWRFHNFGLNFDWNSPSFVTDWYNQVSQAASWSVQHGAPMVLGSWGFHWIGSPQGDATVLARMRSARDLLIRDSRLASAAYWHRDASEYAPNHYLTYSWGGLTPEGDAYRGCGEFSCSPVQGSYISHFTGAYCDGTESYYTPYFYSDGIRRSWDGRGLTGTTVQTLTLRSYKTSDGVCHANAWPNGNRLSGMVAVYDTQPVCREASCVGLGGSYISHYTGSNCDGTESYYTPYFYSDGIRRSWDGRGIAGTALQTLTTRSYRTSDGVCHANAWPGGNVLSGMVRIYRR